MVNKVVLHFTGGMIQKGTTDDFSPNKENFHLKDNQSGTNILVSYPGLKAIFFVKDFAGNPEYREKTDIERAGFGKKIRVVFTDGETQLGYTQGFAPNRPGFFIFPVDPQSNNERIFVVMKSTREVQFV